MRGMKWPALAFSAIGVAVVTRWSVRKPQARPRVPRGPPDVRFLEHQSAVDDFILLMNGTRVSNLGSTPLPELVGWNSHIEVYYAEWINRVSIFRRKLREAIPSGRVSTAHRQALRVLDGGNAAYECPCESTDVADVSLVIPISFDKFNQSWPFMESLIGQHVLPRETVLVLSGVDSSRRMETLAFLAVISEEYVKRLPSASTLVAYGSPSDLHPPDRQWFGFNRTTSPVVTFFDGHDYMHPMLISFVQQAFKLRPELDHMPVQYSAWNMDGKCDQSMVEAAVTDYLSRTLDLDTVSVLAYPMSAYDDFRQELPTWNKTWYVGNTDAEPNWGDEEQRWWDAGCKNGWVSFKREVMVEVPLPIGRAGGSDAIFNYRVARAGFNYRCMHVVMGLVLERPCGSL